MSTPISTNNDNQATKVEKSKRPPLNQRLGFWVSVLIIVVLVAVLWQEVADIIKRQRRNQPIPVVVARAKTSDVPVYLSGLGGVSPTFNVTVRTQINGTLLKVLYREGQIVKKGDMLAQIDPRTYQAQLLQYQGQLVRDQALLANALIDLKRYQTLWRQDSVSQQTLATQQSLVQQYKGAVQIDQGLIDATKVNLQYCNITAPVNGRIGLRLVDPGNFVQTSDTAGIAVINTLNPITVIFTIPEDNIQDIVQKVYANETLPVQAYDRQQKQLLAEGKLITMDNQIDPNTGTVRLRAEFPNENNALFPSQFVNVRLLEKTIHNAIVVPTAAIQYNTKGTFIYVLNPDQSTVSVKPVTVGVSTDGETVINAGIHSGDLVVTDGTDKLVDGSRVTLPEKNNHNGKNRRRHFLA